MADEQNPDDVLGAGPPEDEAKRIEYDRVKKLMTEYTAARAFDKSARRQYAVDRRYAAGTADLTWAVNTNLIGAFIDVLVAYLYARDPDVAVRKVEHVEPDPQLQLSAIRKAVEAEVQALQGAGMLPMEPMGPPAADPMADPAAPMVDPMTMFIDQQVQQRMLEAVEEKRQKDAELTAFAKTIELVVRRLWKDGHLKKAARKAVRSALSVGVGWLKVVMQVDKLRDPIVESQLNDLRDNLERIRGKQREIASGDAKDPEVAAAELQDQIRGLEAKVEVVVRKALAIDFCRAEDVQVSLDVTDLPDYLEANWVANAIYVPKDELAGRFPRLTDDQVKKATCYFQRQPKDEMDLTPTDGTPFDRVSERDAESFTQGQGGEGAVEFAKVIELWDRRDNLIKTMIEGVPCWARDPYPPPQASRRFFPYFLIAFYEVDGARHPQSTSWRLKKLQDEYAAARSNFRKTRERAVPGIIFNAEQVDPENARKLEQSTQQEFVGIRTTNPEIPFTNLFAEKPVARVDPALFDVEPILRDMEKISGVQESLQASVVQPKTATEAEIQQSGFAARTSTDRDTLEEVLADLAQYTTEIALQTLTIEEVQRIAGEYAFWPHGMAIEDIVTMVEVEIAAGTTGKPNTAAEREAWSVALPLIKETMLEVAQFRASGNEPLAQALEELLRETLNRLDDRVDIERFIPQVNALTAPMMPAAAGPDGAPAGPDGLPAPENQLPPEAPVPGVAERLPGGVVA